MKCAQCDASGRESKRRGSVSTEMGKRECRRWAGSDPAPVRFSGDVLSAVSTEFIAAGMLIMRHFSSSLPFSVVQ